MYWFTSDTHFNHKNICKGVSKWDVEEGLRPFDDVEVMNNLIINNINSKVKQEDTLFIVGDFCFSSNLNKIKDIREQINCKIILVLGNHDNVIKSNKKNIQDIFDKVCLMYSLKTPELSEAGIPSIEMCHYPIIAWNKSGKGSVMLHGHCHGSLKLNIPVGRMFDVGVDCNNYTPLSLTEITEKARQTPIITYDHH